MLRSAWRQLIWLYCKGVEEVNFPAWAIDKLEEDVIMQCLEAEFGRQGLASYWWGSEQQRTKKMLTQHMEVDDPRFLALWFGALPKLMGYRRASHTDV
jgi:hypothetical protein